MLQYEAYFIALLLFAIINVFCLLYTGEVPKTKTVFLFFSLYLQAINECFLNEQTNRCEPFCEIPFTKHFTNSETQVGP